MNDTRFIELLNKAYQKAENLAPTDLLGLPDDCIQDLRIIIQNAEKFKGVLSVTLTSIVYKVLYPSQDIRNHQEGMPNGYSGRTIDTKYVTPFFKKKFPHYAMSESGWLTRSLEQPHPYDFNYPGKIKNVNVKKAFLTTLDRLQNFSQSVNKILIIFMSLMTEESEKVKRFSITSEFSQDFTVAKIVEAVQRHIYYRYSKGAVGTARIPVLAIYAIYNLLMSEVKRYSGKKLMPLETHTSPDSRSKALGDIQVNNDDGSCFEAIELKHLKAITVDIIDMVYKKIQNTQIDRYYILTTSEPNIDNQNAVNKKMKELSFLHPCQIIVNGIIPSLKYYLRLISHPNEFIDEYTKWLEFEYERGSGIKVEHLEIWHKIHDKIFEKLK